jgi:hypothetical protein
MHEEINRCRVESELQKKKEWVQEAGLNYDRLRVERFVWFAVCHLINLERVPNR